MADIYRVAETRTGEVWTVDASSPRVAVGRILEGMEGASKKLPVGRELHLAFAITNKGPAVYGYKLTWKRTEAELAELEVSRRAANYYYPPSAWDAIDTVILRSDKPEYDDSFTAVGPSKTTRRAADTEARRLFTETWDRVKSAAATS
jgi:hypothetical protein